MKKLLSLLILVGSLIISGCVAAPKELNTVKVTKDSFTGKEIAEAKITTGANKNAFLYIMDLDLMKAHSSEGITAFGEFSQDDRTKDYFNVARVAFTDGENIVTLDTVGVNDYNHEVFYNKTSFRLYMDREQIKALRRIMESDVVRVKATDIHSKYIVMEMGKTVVKTFRNYIDFTEGKIAIEDTKLYKGIDY